MAPRSPTATAAGAPSEGGRDRRGASRPGGHVTSAPSLLARALNNRNVLGLLFLFPAAALLLVFLTYPLGLGVWLGFTDTTIGRPGRFVGLQNFSSLVHDSVFWLSVWNTFLYTAVASAV